MASKKHPKVRVEDYEVLSGEWVNDVLHLIIENVVTGEQLRFTLAGVITRRTSSKAKG